MQWVVRSGLRAMNLVIYCIKSNSGGTKGLLLSGTLESRVDTLEQSEQRDRASMCLPIAHPGSTGGGQVVYIVSSLFLSSQRLSFLILSWEMRLKNSDGPKVTQVASWVSGDLNLNFPGPRPSPKPQHNLDSHYISSSYSWVFFSWAACLEVSSSKKYEMV